MTLFAKRGAHQADDDEEARWAERRAQERHDVEIKVDLGTENNFYQGFTENVSEGGVFVSTWNRLAIGERLMVRMHLDDGGEVLEISCEVRWVRPQSEDDAGGLGLRFVALDPESHSRITAFLARRDPLFYEE